MIANLITTLMLALGVATGNVSSNVYKGGNAFNNVVEKHKKPIQKANETILLTRNTTPVNTYSYVWGITNRVANKYYYKYNNFDANISNSTVIGNMYGCNYQDYTTTFTQTPSSNIDVSENVMIIRVDPYITLTNSTARYQFTLKSNNYSGNNNNIKLSYYYVATKYNFDSYIDLTRWDNEYYDIETELLNHRDKELDFKSDVNHQYTAQDITINLNVNSGYQDGSYWLVGIEKISVNWPQNTGNNFPYINSDEIEINAEYYAEINYEIIDVPNLMFTILTLPFAWYSTAFNLTIFAGTPYAINFGNVILTIVGALILLYLIKKVFK